MNSVSLSDFLEARGFFCSICTEVYNPNDPNKKPTMLSCEQHNICIGCLQMMKNRLGTCPECRAPLTFKAVPAVNSATINGMEMATELWKALYGPKDVEAEAQRARVGQQPVQPAEPLFIPENFTIISLDAIAKKQKDSGEVISAALPSVIETMNWREVAKELEQDFHKSEKEWIYICDTAADITRGIAWIQNPKYNEWETHWCGVTTPNEALYVECYKGILQCILPKVRSNMGNEWQTFSLSTYFNYATEEKWLLAVQRFLIEHTIRHELFYHFKHWGCQAQLKVYPISKGGRYQKDFNFNPQWSLEQWKTPQEMLAPAVKRILEVVGLGSVFRQCAAENNEPEEKVGFLKDLYINNPLNFFVYALENQAKGFVYYTKTRYGGLQVQNCGLVDGSKKCADHFIQSFFDWANTQRVGVTFEAHCTKSFVLRQAIDRSLRK